VLRIVETDTHLDGKESFDRIAEGAKDFVDFSGIAQEASAYVLLVNARSGAAHVEIDAGNGVLLEEFDGAFEMENIFADHLSENGPAGFVLGDGGEDVFFETRVFVDSKVFCKEIVGSSAVGDDAHEREVGDVLHGSQGSDSLAGVDLFRQDS